MNDTIKRAVKRFGLTDNPVNAAFVLPDGTMLDFSGKGEKDEVHHPIEKLPHGEISRIFTALLSDEEASLTFEKEGAIRVWIPKLGAQLNVSLELSQDPTTAQWRQLEMLANNQPVYYEIYRGRQGKYGPLGGNAFIEEVHREFNKEKNRLKA